MPVMVPLRRGPESRRRAAQARSSPLRSNATRSAFPVWRQVKPRPVATRVLSDHRALEQGAIPLSLRHRSVLEGERGSATCRRFAPSLKLIVAYLDLNFAALWKKHTTLPSVA